MMAMQDLVQKQEDKDAKRAYLVSELKKQWFNYIPIKRVQLTKSYPEIAESILSLIEQ